MSIVSPADDRTSDDAIQEKQEQIEIQEKKIAEPKDAWLKTAKDWEARLEKMKKAES